MDRNLSSRIRVHGYDSLASHRFLPGREVVVVT
jgi:hypothetical protein